MTAGLARAAWRAGRSQAGADAAVHRCDLFLLRKTPALFLRPFNCLDEAHPHHRGEALKSQLIVDATRRGPKQRLARRLVE